MHARAHTDTFIHTKRSETKCSYLQCRFFQNCRIRRTRAKSQNKNELTSLSLSLTKDVSMSHSSWHVLLPPASAPLLSDDGRSSQHLPDLRTSFSFPASCIVLVVAGLAGGVHPASAAAQPRQLLKTNTRCFEELVWTVRREGGACWPRRADLWQTCHWIASQEAGAMSAAPQRLDNYCLRGCVRGSASLSSDTRRLATVESTICHREKTHRHLFHNFFVTKHRGGEVGMASLHRWYGFHLMIENFGWSTWVWGYILYELGWWLGSVEQCILTPVRKTPFCYVLLCDIQTPRGWCCLIYKLPFVWTRWPNININLLRKI